MLNVFAQVPPDKILEQASKIVEEGDPYSALDMLQEAHQQYPEHMGLAFELAELHRLTRDYANAAPIYKQVYEAEPGTYPIAQLYHGEMLQRNGKYEEAITVLEDVEKNYRGPDRYGVSEKAENLIKGSRLALAAQDSTSKTKVRHLGTEINSGYTDLSPVWKDNSTMIYAALRIDTVVKFDPTLSSIKEYVKFYEAKKQGDQWQFVGPLEGPFNHKKYDNGNGTFSPDGKSFFFTRCKVEGTRTLCQIYKSEQDGDDWSKPELLDETINAEGYTATQPFVSTNPRNGAPVLYFASDRRGSKGGLDIWLSQYDNRTKRWRNPSNLGRKVNTEGDEMTPFYDAEKEELYFSSEGWVSVGGLDVYKVRGQLTRIVSNPENLGPPINSPADDIYFRKNKETNTGFIVSNRLGGIALKNATCCDDIYEILFPEPIVIAVTGTVSALEVDGSIKGAIPSAQVYLIDVITRDTLNVDTTGSEGGYFFEIDANKRYQIIASHADYLNNLSDTLSTIGVSESDTFIISPLLLMPITKATIQVDNIYYEFNSSELNLPSQRVLDTTIYKLLRDNESLKLEIHSHTDDMGEDDYNLKLSQERAQGVVDYLIAKGISHDRLKAIGFGESQPIAPNTNPDGSDNPEGRAKNRRTEFRIIGLERDGVEVIYKE